MGSPLYPPADVGAVQYRYNNKSYSASWPYFTYDSKGRNALQRQALSLADYTREYGSYLASQRNGSLEFEQRLRDSAIQNVLDKIVKDKATKDYNDNRARISADMAQASSFYTALEAGAAATAVISPSNPIPPAPKPFTANKPIAAAQIVVTNVKANSIKALKTVINPPKKKLPSPGKSTPNVNPVVPPPPPPPPMQNIQPCPAGSYVDKFNVCVKCPVKSYIKGSGCAPCPPGTTGESIHTGCSSVGPDGKTYTFIA